MTDPEKRFIHEMYRQFYTTKKKQRARDKCICCGELRVLGVKGKARLKCKQCRKKETK